MEAKMSTKFLRKILVATIVATATAAPAYGESGWVLAADSAKGDSRYLINVEKFAYKVTRQGDHFFTAPLRAVQDGELTEGTVAVNAQSCVNSGGSIFLVSDGTKDVKRWWWTTDGNRIYDGIARTVCSVAVEYAKLAAETPDNKPESAGPQNASSRGYQF
jgi:hypothetical protein